MINSPPEGQLRRSQPKRTIRASRPALVDLRFKGDAWVVAHDETQLSVCLGDYPLALVGATAVDLATLGNTFVRLRLGQARRQYLAHLRREGVKAKLG